MLPLNSDDRVAVDAVIEDVDLFRVYRKKDEVLVMLRQKDKNSISFMVRGVPEIIKKKKKPKKHQKPQKPQKAKKQNKKPKQPIPKPGTAPTPSK
jgi:uncharacterized spore protein YtfJ